MIQQQYNQTIQTVENTTELLKSSFEKQIAKEEGTSIDLENLNDI